MREDSRAEGELLLKVAFGETIMVYLKLYRPVGGQVGVKDAKGVKIGDMVASDLIGTYEKLNLQVIRKVRAAGNM